MELYMGQRHQVYIRLPKKYYDEQNPNNHPAKVVGIHHQWLYGRTALRLLGNLLEFHTKSAETTYDNESRFLAGYGDEAEMLAAIYSCDVREGYFHRTSVLDEAEAVNPFMGANNDGITVIDFTDAEGKSKSRPTYCFASLGATEGKVSLKAGTYTAEQYVLSYYPKFIDERRNGNIDDITEECRALIERIDSRADVMSDADLVRIFPAFKGKIKRRAARKSVK
jgi:hypothetical protein